MNSVAFRCLILILLAVLLHLPVQAATTRLTFILASNTQRIDEENGRGGLARLNAVVKGERANGGHVVYVHAGGVLSPSPFSYRDQGAHAVSLLNLAPPTIFVPAAVEFDFGPDIFVRRMAEANFPVVAANLRKPDGRLFPATIDKMTATIEGTNIAMIGMAADDSPRRSKTGALKFLPTVETAIAMARRIRSVGADFVVLIARASSDQVTQLHESRAFDLILTGGGDDLLLTYDGRTAIAQSRANAEFLAAIDITIDSVIKDGKRTAVWRPSFRVIDTSALEPDRETQELVERIKTQLAE
jgi:2',3'-cyclic-nucleotide 2'-phosphodiesterase (5'-nucleotidase family)